jgi:hypothetical protein
VGSFEKVPSVPNEANTNKSIIAKLVSCFPAFFGEFDNLKQIYFVACSSFFTYNEVIYLYKSRRPAMIGQQNPKSSWYFFKFNMLGGGGEGQAGGSKGRPTENQI